MEIKHLQKCCPACGGSFATRWDRQVCCSRSCARKHQNDRLGNGNWKGGRWKVNTGYWKVKADGHPHADANGYILEHRLVMERVLGRILDPRERVHHKNGIRDDNRPENLELWTLDHKDPPGVRVSDVRRDSSWVTGLLAA